MISNNQVALCNELNMNFDEASELFCEESLQSMQMAKISGGAENWFDKVIKAIDLVIKLYGIGLILAQKIKEYFSNGRATPSPNAQIDVSMTPTDGGTAATCVIRDNGIYYSASCLITQAPATLAPTA